MRALPFFVLGSVLQCSRLGPQRITIKHLATQTAGLAKPGGFEPLLFAPGSAWAYSDGGPNWLADVLTVRFKQDLRNLLFSRVFSKVGSTSADLVWRLNAYRPKTLVGVTRREFGAGISANVNAMARLGYLYLRKGTWNGASLLPGDYIDTLRRPVSGVIGSQVGNNPYSKYGNAPNHYGFLWWNNEDGAMAAPRDV